MLPYLGQRRLLLFGTAAFCVGLPLAVGDVDLGAAEPLCDVDCRTALESNAIPLLQHPAAPMKGVYLPNDAPAALVSAQQVTHSAAGHASHGGPDPPDVGSHAVSGVSHDLSKNGTGMKLQSSAMPLLQQSAAPMTSVYLPKDVPAALISVPQVAHSAAGHGGHGGLDPHGGTDKVKDDSEDALIPDAPESDGGFSKNGTGIEDGDIPTQQVSLALSVELLMMVAVVMGLFTLVNYPRDDIQEITWNIISSSLSIFSAVQFFDAVLVLAGRMFGEPEEINTAPTLSELRFDLFRFVGIALFLELAVWQMSSNAALQRGVGIMGGHVLGFAGLELFGNMQQMQLWAASPLMSLVSNAVATACLGGLIYGAAWMRHETAWCSLVCQGEDDGFGVAMGRLVSQTVKFGIVGKLMPLHGNPHHKTLSQIRMLLLVSVAFMACLIPVCRWAMKLEHGSKYKRLARITQTTFTMTIGWLLLDTGRWEFWFMEDANISSVMTGRMVMFVAFMVIGVFFIFLLAYMRDFYVADRMVLQPIINSIGLVIGLSWELCIDTAVEGLATAIDKDGGTERAWLYDLMISMGLVFVVVPPWAFYICPRATWHRAEE